MCILESYCCLACISSLVQVTSYNGILELVFKFEVNCTAVELDPNSYVANNDVILEVLFVLLH